MGGELGVDSEEGKGSTFWFDLSFPVGVKNVPHSALRLGDARVLVVDDSVLTSRYLAQVLTRLKVNHEVAEDGVAALEKLRGAAQTGAPYQMVLVDDAMHGMRGNDLVRLIVNDPAITNTRIFMMVDRCNVVNATTDKLNIAGFLSKPTQRKDVAALLSENAGAGDDTLEEADGVTANKDVAKLNFSGSRVLVVEDNRANQQVVLGMLERLGCEAKIASNGLEALELISRERFELVLMDCHMPEMDGYEATAQIRKFEAGKQHIRIVAMTANVQKGEAKKCIAVGMDDYLAKPLKLDSLRATLSRWLKSCERQLFSQ